MPKGLHLCEDEPAPAHHPMAFNPLPPAFPLIQLPAADPTPHGTDPSTPYDGCASMFARDPLAAAAASQWDSFVVKDILREEHVPDKPEKGAPEVAQARLIVVVQSGCNPYRHHPRAGMIGMPLLKYLYCEEKNKTYLKGLYKDQKHFKGTYNDHNQARAQEMLLSMGLDKESLQSLDTKWKVVGTTGRRRRAFNLCCSACGYNSETRRQGRGKGRSAGASGSSSMQATRTTVSEGDRASETKVLRGPETSAGRTKDDGGENVGTRRAPYPFTGCLAHADITFMEETGYVMRILAVFEHNEACREAMMIHYPSVPLHPHVIEVALAQLRGNARPPTSVAYIGDTTGNTLRSTSSARTTKSEWLKVCISIPEMREAAWCYCHGGQLVLNGTFGLCASRLLLWIAMGVDETNTGIPVAMFLFSAPTGTKTTHTGYDTAVRTVRT
ncbi:hypothetical protein GY45DRAFT_1341453 [Cubamyces sp. BRFM 1775]|nr:hypothetical protein GY45DRAFT_1341453 [Cubamyces sp. BRFM 1775]